MKQKDFEQRTSRIHRRYVSPQIEVCVCNPQQMIAGTVRVTGLDWEDGGEDALSFKFNPSGASAKEMNHSFSNVWDE